MNRFRAGLGVVLMLLAGSVSGLEIIYSSTNPFDGTPGDREGLLLKGEIVPGDYEYMLAVIRNDPERFWRIGGFVLASPGGDVQEAIRIAQLVKGTYKSVFVGESTGPCVSACFFVFATAARREASPRMVAIHRPYVHPKRLINLTPSQAEAMQKDALRLARSYLEDLQVPFSLIDAMVQRASTEVHWLSRYEIEEQLGRRPPWYEQFLIGRCGLDKTLERKYFATNDRALLDQLLKVDECGHRLSKPEAEAYLRAQLRRPTKR